MSGSRRKRFERLVVAADLTPTVARSAGNINLGVARNRDNADRMQAVIRFTDVENHYYAIEVGPAELRGLLEDALRLLTADQAQIGRLWAQLVGGENTAPHVVGV